MVINSDNKIAYICSRCGNGIRRSLNLFSFSDGLDHAISCPVCGNDLVRMKKSKKNSFDLSAKCVYCGETHHKIISAHDMRRGIFGALKCPIADLGAVFYGSNGKQLSDAMTDVFKVMEELMAEYEKPSSDLQIRSMTTQNSHIKSSIEQEMLNAFGTLNREQNISCVCGNTEIAVSISDDHKILLRCAVCGKEKKYDITKDNLLRLINTSFVVLSD